MFHPILNLESHKNTLSREHLVLRGMVIYNVIANLRVLRCSELIQLYDRVVENCDRLTARLSTRPQ